MLDLNLTFLILIDSLIKNTENRKIKEVNHKSVSLPESISELCLDILLWFENAQRKFSFELKRNKNDVRDNSFESLTFLIKR